ncbi:MAG: YafY family transcriptional regulator [Alphaproteobacteria bacterium]|nr:YafY family transcriptional regulator [Alphaproteobacteria bacterium]MCB9797604.1 YafY family transcriptional regulator [Alphaproteobacteria bacterium]
MRRADRLFRIVQLLRSRSLVTAEQLAEELGVSKRTIYRDVRDLQESDVPIRGEAGVGYAMERGFELPPLTFTTEQIEALVLGARMVEAWGDPELAEASRAALGKVEAVLPSALRRVLLDTQLHALRFGPRDEAPALSAFRRAIGERQKLRLRYADRHGEVSERVVWPLGLYFWGRSWSLAAWCELRQDYRNFRPDRVEGVELLDEGFELDGVSLEAFVAQQTAQQSAPR